MASAQLSARGMSVYSESVLKLLGDSGESDVELICDGQIFPSHKCFLSISSTKLAERFDSDPDLKVVYIPDVQPNILELVLQYVYAAKLDEMDMATAPALYHAAATYGIFPLKRLCGAYIVKNLREDNACEVLRVAAKLSSKEDRSLMKAVASYVANNEEFLESNTWKCFATKHKADAERLLESMK